MAPGALKAMDPKAMPRADRDALVAKAEAFALEPFGRHGWASPLKGMPDRVAKHLGGGPGTPAFDDWANHPALRILYVNTFRRIV